MIVLLKLVIYLVMGTSMLIMGGSILQDIWEDLKDYFVDFADSCEEKVERSKE